MARPLRIEYPGAWYHVMNRGARGENIFTRDEHREYFLLLLGEAQERFNAEWHAYCLMGNHYHLLIRTPEGNLQRIMRHINGVYTQYFNRTVGRDGPLFRGRYKAVLVDAQAHWLQLSRYIHRNPLGACMCDGLGDYIWSSYRAYVGLERPPDWLTTAYVLGAIGQREQRASYKAYVARETDKALLAFYAKKKIKPVLGADDFRSRVLAGIQPKVDIPELRAVRVVPTVYQISHATCRYFEESVSAIYKSKRGKGVVNPARSVAMYLCQHVGDLRLREIAKVFGLSSYASAGATIRLFKRRIETNEALAKAINTIILDLTR